MEPKDPERESFDPSLIETFKRIERIVANLPQGSVQKVTVMKGGGIDVTSLAEIMAAQPSINLCDLKKDDVVWWITKNGGKYYHMVKNLYGLGEGAVITKEGNGPFKGITSRGENVEVENAGIHGSSYGGALKLFHINQGVPVEVLFFPKNPGERGKTFITSSVSSMGVIKAEQYKNH